MPLPPNTGVPSKLVPPFPHTSTPSPGVPVTEVFTLKPLEFGKPNTLVCFVSNLFPPTLTVTWQHHSGSVESSGPTFVSAVDGLSFQAFSYLNFTPAPSDLFSCLVTHEIDGYTAIAYWGETLLPGSLVHLWVQRDRPTGEPSSLLGPCLVHSHSEATSVTHTSVSPLSCQKPHHSSGWGAPQRGLGAHLLPFVSSAPQRAALRSFGECAVRRGLRPGCAGHHRRLGPHHQVPEALLGWYVRHLEGLVGRGSPTVVRARIILGMGRVESGPRALGWGG